MPRGDFLQAALLARIANSPHTIEVHYPPARAGSVAVAPFPPPASPLTGAPPAPSLVTTAPAEGAKPVTMSCLWMEKSATSLGSPYTIDPVAEVPGAEIVIRVAVSDAALNPDRPHEGTILDTAAFLVHDGMRYRWLKSKPVSASFLKPVTYLIWLKGPERPDATLPVQATVIGSVVITSSLGNSLSVSQTGTFSATVRDGLGTVLVSHAAVTYKSSAPSVVSVTAPNAFTAAGIGSATITATCGGRTTTLLLTVS